MKLIAVPAVLLHVPQNVQTIIFKIAGKGAPRGPGQ